MQGVGSDCDPNTTPREPTQATRIRWLLDEIRSRRLPRLAQLRGVLQAEAAEWDHAHLAQALSAFLATGRTLHFMPLRQGWIARLLGRHREACAQFATACQRMSACEAQMKAQLTQLAAAQQEHHFRARQALADLEAETQALSTAIYEAVTALHEMCTQLADARGAGREDDDLATMAETAQFFMQELRRLQSVSSVAQDAGVRARSVLTRRSVLLEQARGELVTFEQAWVHRLGEVAAALDARRDPQPHIPKAIEVHDELMKRLEASTDACAALQHEEHVMAHQLAMLQRELEQPSESEA